MQSRWTFLLVSGVTLLLTALLGLVLLVAPAQRSLVAPPAPTERQAQLLPVIMSAATMTAGASPTPRAGQLLPVVISGPPTSAPSTSPYSGGTTAPPDAALGRSIVVVGEGEVAVKPDIAQATIGVESFAPTVAEATAANERAMTAVLAALKRSVAEEDIWTASYTIFPERSYDQKGAGSTTGYRITNVVQVTLRDLTQVSVTLDRATKAGANQIVGVSFGLAPQTQRRAEDEARRKAVAALRERAGLLAQLNDVRVGPLLALSEEEGATPWTSGVVQGAGGAGGPPVTPGTLVVRVRLRATYGMGG